MVCIFLLLSLYASSAGTIIFSTFLFCTGMRQFQHFEYHRHIRGTIALSIAFTLSLTIVMLYIYHSVVQRLIYLTGRKIGLQLTQPSLLLVNIGGIDKLQFIFQFVLMLPYVVFLAYRQIVPSHDCFECFNRLPG
jgi:hypothetical protein